MRLPFHLYPDATSKGFVIVLCLFDLSDAFDTVDHAILLGCLQLIFGMSGNVPSWFESYLTSRSSQVRWNGGLSLGAL